MFVTGRFIIGSIIHLTTCIIFSASQDFEDLDVETIFNIDNSSGPHTFLAIAIPDNLLSIWHISALLICTILVLICCAFCIYYPLAATLDN